MRSRWALLLTALLLAGCVAVPTVDERRQNANTLTKNSGWVGTAIASSPYPLYAFLPQRPAPTQTLSIYIEGDGLAWRSRRSISGNPTPIKPVALQLALLDQSAAAYLARPCQYVRDLSRCDPKLWTSARFSSKTVTAANQAVDFLKREFSAKRVRLIGYSGGGAIAALVAAQRNDVAQLVTVAGNLDHVTWAKLHRVSPLDNSLNPADAWRSLQSIPQMHFVGADDRIIDASISASYRRRFPRDKQPAIMLVKGADHHCCWVEKWPALLRTLNPR